MGERLRTNHIWTDTLVDWESVFKQRYCLPLYLCFWIFLLTTFFRDFFMSILCYFFPNLEVGEFEVDEDLDPYYETLDEKSKNWYLKEEENSRLKLKFQVLTDENYY